MNLYGALPPPFPRLHGRPPAADTLVTWDYYHQLLPAPISPRSSTTWWCLSACPDFRHACGVRRTSHHGRRPPALDCGLKKLLAARRPVRTVTANFAVLFAARHIIHIHLPNRLLSTALNAAVHIDETPSHGLPCSSTFVATATTLAARGSAELICHGRSRSPPLPSLVLTRRHHRRRRGDDHADLLDNLRHPFASRCALDATLIPGRPGGYARRDRCRLSESMSPSTPRETTTRGLGSNLDCGEPFPVDPEPPEACAGSPEGWTRRGGPIAKAELPEACVRSLDEGREEGWPPRRNDPTPCMRK
ncbi:hypothetical protein FB107DRAFT_278563 [Schizophyllum commune]